MRDLRAISSGREAKKSMANVIDRLSNGALAMMLILWIYLLVSESVQKLSMKILDKQK